MGAVPPSVSRTSARSVVSAYRSRYNTIRSFHNLTDTSENLRPLFEEIAKAGAKSVAVNYLFLRRSLMKKIFMGIAPPGVSAQMMMQLYRRGPNMPMYRDRSLIRVLPTDFRKTNYARITALAEKVGLAVHLCACKNSDITTSRCNIAGPPACLPPDLFSTHL